MHAANSVCAIQVVAIIATFWITRLHIHNSFKIELTLFVNLQQFYLLHICKATIYLLPLLCSFAWTARCFVLAFGCITNSHVAFTAAPRFAILRVLFPLCSSQTQLGPSIPYQASLPVDKLLIPHRYGGRWLPRPLVVCSAIWQQKIPATVVTTLPLLWHLLASPLKVWFIQITKSSGTLHKIFLPLPWFFDTTRFKQQQNMLLVLT